MDPTKLVELLHHYPAWFKGAIVLWLVMTALLVGGLVVLRPMSASPVVQAVPSGPIANEPTTPVATTLDPISLPAPVVASTQIAATPEEYAKRLRSLSDRFLERQEFVERHQGAEVEWTGVVNRVSQHAQSKSLSLMLTSQQIAPELEVLVALPDFLRTKAFSLQKGDVIRVTGKLTGC